MSWPCIFFDWDGFGGFYGRGVDTDGHHFCFISGQILTTTFWMKGAATKIIKLYCPVAGFVTDMINAMTNKIILTTELSTAVRRRPCPIVLVLALAVFSTFFHSRSSLLTTMIISNSMTVMNIIVPLYIAFVDASGSTLEMILVTTGIKTTPSIQIKLSLTSRGVKNLHA